MADDTYNVGVNAQSNLGPTVRVDAAEVARLTQTLANFEHEASRSAAATAALATPMANLRAQLAAAQAGTAQLSNEIRNIPAPVLPVEPMNNMRLATAGTTREFIVLGHEMMVGNFSRVPGSLLVLLERMGSLQKVTAALVSPIGAASLGLVALAGAAIYFAYEAYEDQKSIEGITERLNLFGNATAQTASQVEAMQNRLRTSFNLWDSDSRKLTQTFATIPGVTQADQEALAGLAVTIAAASHGQIPLAKAMEEVAGAAEKGPKALQTLAEKFGYTGESAGTLHDEIQNVTGAVEANEGAVVKSRAAWQEWLTSWRGILTAIGAGQAGISISNLGPPQVTPRFDEGLPEAYKTAMKDIDRLSVVEQTRRNNQGILNTLVAAEVGLRQNIAGGIGNIVQEQQKLKDTEQAIGNLVIEMGKKHSEAETDAHNALISQLETQRLQETSLDKQLEITKQINAEREKWNQPIPIPQVSIGPAGGGERAPAGRLAGEQASFVEPLERLITDAASHGLTIGIASGFRTAERQAQLFAEAVAKYGSEAEARKWVAPPGSSMHNKGLAADLSGSPEALAYAHQHAAEFGLTFPMGNEPWHIEPTGARGSAGSAKQEQADLQATIKTQREKYQVTQVNIEATALQAKTVADHAKALRDEAAAAEQQAHAPGVNELEAAQLHKQAAELRKQADNSVYQAAKQNTLNQIEDAKAASAKIVDDAQATAAQKIAAEQKAKTQIQGLWAALVAEARSLNINMGQEWEDVQRRMVAAAVAADKQISALQKKSDKTNFTDALRDAKQAASEASGELREFEADMRAQVATHNITPQQAVGFDIQELGRQRTIANSAFADMVNSATTPQELKIVEQAQARVNLRFDEQGAQLTAKWAETGEKAAAAFAKPFQSIFDSIGSEFEKTITDLLLHKGTNQNIWKSFYQNMVGQAVKGVGDVASGALAGLVPGHKEGDTLGASLAKFTGQQALQLLQAITANTWLAGIFTNTGATATASAAGASGTGSIIGGIISGAASLIAAPFTGGASLIGGLIGQIGGGAASDFGAPSGIAGFFGNVLGLTGKSRGGIVVPAAAAGFSLPRNFGTDSVMAALTPGETVLPVGERPSAIAEALAGGRGAGGHTFNIAPGGMILDGPSFSRYMQREGRDAILAVVKRAMLPGGPQPWGRPA